MKVIDVDLTFQRVTDDGAVTTNNITTADILLTNQSGSNSADAGNLYFIESGTGWGSGITGFRFHHDGSTNLLTLQAGNTSTVVDVLSIERDTADVGIGTVAPTARLHIASDASSTDESLTVENGNSETTLQLLDDGTFKLPKYGSGTFTGTAVKTLAVDSSGNVIEIDGGGTIDGSGTTNFITKWVDADTLTDSVMYEDNSKIGIGTGAVEPSETLEVVGNVEAEEFIGDLRGSVLFKAEAGEDIDKGEVVYISGISGNTTIVSLADSNDAAKMPAFGVASETKTSGNPINIYTFGILTGLDTSTPGFSIGDELYVSTVAGVLLNSPPIFESSQVQKVGKVTRVHASQGSIFIAGAGRSNATPNLDTGRLFVGNSSFQAVADDTVYIDIANTEVGINNTTPAATLHVKGTTDDGTTNLFKFNNLTDIDRLFMNGAGRLFLETDNDILMVMNRPGEQPVLNFQNNNNEGAIGYAGNGEIRFSSGIVQRTGTDFDWAVGRGTGTFEASTKSLTVLQDDSIQFNNYGSGTHTGTVTKFLGVDSSGNIIEEEGVSSPSEAFFAYNSLGATSPGTTATTLFMDTVGFNSNTSIFSLSGNTITVNAAIRAYVSYHTSFKTPSATRTTVRTFVEVSTDGGSTWNEVEGSRSHAYVRQGVSNDDSSCAGSFIRTSADGDQYRLMAGTSAGNVSQVEESCGISIMDLKGGEQGPQGVAGSSYTLSATQNGSNVDIDLDASTGTDSQISLVAGTGITLTESSDAVTIDAVEGVTVSGTPSANDIVKFSTTSTITNSVMREFNSNIGIGVTSPSNKLEVDGTTKSTTFLVGDSINHDGDVDTGIDFTNNQIQLRANGVEAITVKSTGVVALDDYGLGNNTGTQAVNLEADSSGNIIERIEERGTFSGTTSLVGELTISHGLGSSPTFVLAMPGNYGSQPDGYNVESVTSTTFKIRCRNNLTAISGYYLVSL